MYAKKGFCMQCATSSLVRQSFGGAAKGAYAPKAVVSNLKSQSKPARVGYPPFAPFRSPG